jgi:hypothetical protein
VSLAIPKDSQLVGDQALLLVTVALREKGDEDEACHELYFM